MTSYDAIVIGTGQAGPSLAKRLAGAGRRVAIIEREAFRRHLHQHRLHADQDAGRQRLRSAHGAPRGEFGIVVDGVAVDMRRVKQRKDDNRASGAPSTEASLRATANCTVYRGHARFVAPARARSRQRAPCARPQIFINVGGRAAAPAIPGIDTVPI